MFRLFIKQRHVRVKADHLIRLLHSSLESSVELLLTNKPHDAVLSFKERADRSIEELHPLEKNVFALGLLFSGDTSQALSVQTQVLKNFTQSLGSTSDSFLDIAGSINDLAVMHMANRDYLSAEKQLKRALLMVERSYRVDNHLRSALLANLSDLHCLAGNKESSLQYADLLIPCINAHQFIPTKGSAVDSTKLAAIETNDINSIRFGNIQNRLKDRIEIENTMDQISAEEIVKESGRITAGIEERTGESNTADTNNFYYSRDNMNELKLVAKEGLKKEIKQKEIGFQNRFYYSRDSFASIRTVQYVLSAGLCIGTNRLHEEGLIHINRAFDLILKNSSQENPQNFLYQDSFLLSVALSKLATLSDHSMKTRNRGISSKHIQNDSIKSLFNLPYFKQNFPGICDLELSLSSSYRDLKNASIQIYKMKSSSPIKQTNKYSNRYIVSKKTEHNLSEYDLLSQYGIGVVGIALMDIEVHCPPDVTN